MRHLRRNPLRGNADEAIATKQRQLNDIRHVHARRCIDKTNTAAIIWMHMNTTMRLIEAMQKPRHVRILRIRRIERRKRVKLNHDNPKPSNNRRPRIKQITIFSAFNINLQHQITRGRRGAMHLHPIVKPEAVGSAVDVQPLLVKRLQPWEQRRLETLYVAAIITQMTLDSIQQRKIILEILVVIDARRKAAGDSFEIIWNQVGTICIATNPDQRVRTWHGAKESKGSHSHWTTRQANSYVNTRISACV